MDKLYERQVRKKERYICDYTPQDTWAAHPRILNLGNGLNVEVGKTTGKKNIQDNAIQPAGCMVNVMGLATAKELGAAQAGDCKEAKARQTKARPLY